MLSGPVSDLSVSPLPVPLALALALLCHCRQHSPPLPLLGQAPRSLAASIPRRSVSILGNTTCTYIHTKERTSHNL